MRKRPLGNAFLFILAGGISFASTLGKDSDPAIGDHLPGRVPASVREVVPVLPEKALPSPKVNSTSLWPETGERWIFRFERKVSAEYLGKVWLKLALGGRASVEPVGEFGDHRFFMLSYEIDRMQMQGEGAASEKNERRSFPPIRIEVDAAGLVRESRWTSISGKTSEPSEEDADFVKDVTAQWLFFESRSRLGIADASFTTTVDSSSNHTVSKRITRYEGRPEITDLESNHEWATDTHRVQRIEGTENFSLKSAQGTFDQKTSYRWVFLTSEKSTALARNLSLGTPFLVSDVGIPTETARPVRIDLKTFAVDWKAIGSLTPHARLRYFGVVKKALDAGQGELVPVILQSLAGRDSTSLEWRTGVGALAASSNPDAARALLELYRGDSLGHDDKLSVLAAVTSGEGAPAPEWKEVLAEEVRAKPSASDHGADTSVRDASLFALGSAIRKETDLGRRKELEGLLWKEVKDSTSDSAQLVVLDAIGNSGSSEYYPYVKERFASTNAGVRAKAVGAVRFLAADLAQPILDTARADPSPVVRKAAEWSGKFREPASTPAQ